VLDVVEPGSLVHTDANPSYADLEDLGCTHVVTIQRQSPTPAHVEMPAVHRVASLVKRWILGTHQGGLAKQHLNAYLDEFVFRFNRRAARNRGLVFYRLLQQCLQTQPGSYKTIVLDRQWQRGLRLGPAPKRSRGGAQTSRRSQ
jgi:hypothetical protein